MGRKFVFTHNKGTSWWRSSLVERGHTEGVRRLNALKHCDIFQSETWDNIAVTQMRKTPIVTSSMGQKIGIIYVMALY